MGRQAGEARLLGRGAGHHGEQINCHAAIPQTSPRGTTPTTGQPGTPTHHHLMTTPALDKRSAG